ncbi:hypothetical protein MLD38_027719 [Melastoma candidum]|nr:hypothetical protein MLD38_027719 [Melastoma candidum]
MASSSLLFVLLALLAVVPSSCATGEVVRRVCRRASDYEYCVNTLNSDPRSPDADRYLLAYISFGMAFTNASSTLDYISRLLKSGWSNDTKLADGLRECRKGYKKGVAAMVSANNDLNSETYYYLAEYADTAARGANVCQAAIAGTRRPPPGLAARNGDMKSLCEICSLVSELFVTSS